MMSGGGVPHWILVLDTQVLANDGAASDQRQLVSGEKEGG